MIMYMQARKIAEEELANITKVTDEKDAYIFVDENQKWDGILAVMKEDGRVVGYSEYVMNHDVNEDEDE